MGVANLVKKVDTVCAREKCGAHRVHVRITPALFFFPHKIIQTVRAKREER
jgi:hypothetical protein